MNYSEVAEILRNYHWMINEIGRIRGYLKEDAFKGVAQYGIEATLPKAVGAISDPIANECVRRDQKSRRLERLEKKVQYIQVRIERIQEDREKVVLDCILDGLSNVAISKHLGLTSRHINRIKESIIDQLTD